MRCVDVAPHYLHIDICKLTNKNRQQKGSEKHLSATIPTLSNKDSLEAKASALQQAGCMVIQDVADTTQRNNLVAELQTHMDNAKVRVDDDPDEFYPGLTQRVSGLVTRSETVRALMLHKEATSMLLRSRSG